MADDDLPPTTIDLERLLRAIDASGAEEVYVEAESFVIRFSRTAPLSALSRAPSDSETPSTADAPAAAITVGESGSPVPEPTRVPATGPSSERSNWVPVRSPMAGIFYHCPKPGEPPFVVVGDRVEVGAPIGIVEVMKLMNTVSMELTGIVREIAVGDVAAVGYGETLMWVEPDA